MPVIDTFGEWAAWHGAIFALTTDADRKMLAAWCDLFESLGYKVPELVEATEWLAANRPPKFRTEHLDSLQARLKAQRAEAASRVIASPEEDPRGQCSLCRGTGHVSVPTIRAIQRGQWGTCTVLCSCALGRWHRGQKTKYPLQTLEEYERELPDWRAVLAHHDALVRQEADVRDQTRTRDGVLSLELNRILNRLRARTDQRHARELEREADLWE